MRIGHSTGACPFAYDAQQIMRNHAFSVGLVGDGHADFSFLGLIHHDRNSDVVEHFDAYCNAAADRGRLLQISASAVAACMPKAVGRWMADRYALP